MIKQLLLGGAVVVWATGSASALSMSVTGDNRAIYAEAAAGFDSDSDGDSASGAVFNSTVDASAEANVNPLILGLTNGSGGGGGGIFFGASANASASQLSEIGALSIYASGYANASGDHGDVFAGAISDADGTGAGGGGGIDLDNFEAFGESYLEVMFSIDEDAAFDLSGFLSAGEAVADTDALIGSDVSQSAGVSLVNADTSGVVLDTMISSGSTSLNEAGVLAAGNYVFTIKVTASVDGGNDIAELVVAPIGLNGYTTSAGYKGVSLDLSAIDQPIPEPVTTTLAAMGLGALVLRTSRRRHS